MVMVVHYYYRFFTLCLLLLLLLHTTASSAFTLLGDYGGSLLSSRSIIGQRRFGILQQAPKPPPPSAATAPLLFSSVLVSSRTKKRMTLTKTAATSTTDDATTMITTGNDNNNEKKKKLFLFDFDGVVCDSCDECTVSAWRTCQRISGAIIGSDDNKEMDQKNNTSPPPWLFEKMREIRPAIEVGWQIPVLLSVLLMNHRTEAERKSTSGKQQQQQQQPPVMSVEEILANYEHLVQDWLDKYEQTDRDMIQAFGDVRDEWIANDLESWLDINTFYPGVPDALRHCQGESRLVTTKQHRFAVALCRHAGVDEQSLPDDHIYGLGMYKNKADVIVQQTSSSDGDGGYRKDETYFFEDRWPTLVKCLNDNRLDGVQLHLCSWGYVTPKELELAQAEPRVKVIGLEEFAKIVTGAS